MVVIIGIMFVDWWTTNFNARVLSSQKKSFVLLGILSTVPFSGISESQSNNGARDLASNTKQVTSD
jgi:hypothetical protein